VGRLYVRGIDMRGVVVRGVDVRGGGDMKVRDGGSGSY
jgi:hypothetical protein